MAKREKVDDGLNHISVSQMNTFTLCPKRWVLDKVLKLPSATSHNLIIGVAAHEVLAAYGNSIIEGNPLSKKSMKVIAEGIFDNEYDLQLQEHTHFQDNESTDNARSRFINIVNQIPYWYSDVVGDDIKSVEEEIPKLFVSDDTYILGYADVVTNDNTVIDFKTAGRKHNPDDVHKMFQLSIYARAYKTDNTAIIGIDSKSGKMLSHIPSKRNKRQRSLAMTRAKAIHKAMQAGVDYANTEGWHCSQLYCGHYNNCKYGNGDN